MQFTGDGYVISNTGTLLLGSSSYSGSLQVSEIQVTTGATATIQSAIDSGITNGGLIKTGAGTLVLSNGSNAYTGATQITAGTLSVSAGGNLGSGGFYNSVMMSGGTLQITGSSAFTCANIFLLGASSTINVVNTAGATLTGALIDASVSTSGMLIKSGNGTLTLANTSNSYSGGTTINAGTLCVTADGALGAGGATINGGVLQYTGSDTTSRTFDLNSGAIDAASGVTITYTGTVNGGFLQGAGTHQLATGSILSGTTTYTAATLTQSGSTTLINFTNGGSFTNSGVATWNGGLNQDSGRMTVNGTLNASSWSNNGILTIATTGILNYTGSNLYLGGGSQTYVGSSASPGGTIAMSTGNTIELNGGLLVNNGTIGSSGAGLVDINYGGLAKGAGNYAGGYSVNFGGTFAPGNSPGQVSSGSAVWNGGGSFTFMINNATGTAGTNWSSNVINGTLTINATSSSQFGISIQSLTSGNAPGAVPNFDPTQSYTWTFLQTSGGIIGYNSSAISLGTSGFTNSYTGQFYLVSTGYNLEIEYSPTPEPQHVLGISGLATLLIYFVRRRHSPAALRTPC